ncbi:MAG: TetR/AcrR family transcriptional regulator [Gammaproteobacteria bacterium]|nr:TetR/AcrR family transcriptional regulator [Gammaproteobacteria bacterium]
MPKPRLVRAAPPPAATPARTSRRRLRPAARRAELLGHALAVFARRGLGRAGHAEIAAAAGVAVSTVFVYFPTRADLVDAVLDEVDRFQTELARSIHARAAPASELVLDHIRAFTAAVATHPDHARVWLDWSTAIRDEVWPRYLRFQDGIVAIITVTLQRGQREGDIHPSVDTDAEARLIVGSAHMLAQMAFSRCPPERLERYMRTLLATAVGPGPQAAQDP